MLEPPRRNKKQEPPLDLQAKGESIRAEHDSSPPSEDTSTPCTWCSRIEFRGSRAENGPLYRDLFHGDCDCFLEADLLPRSTCGFCRHMNFKHLFKCTPTKDGYSECPTIFSDWYCEEDVLNDCQFCRLVGTEFQHEGISQVLISVVEDSLSFWVGDERQPRMTFRTSTHPWPQIDDKVDWNRIRTRPLIASGEMGDLPNNFRVIDVVRNCIVCPKDPVHYVALSYVWGRMTGNEFQATLSNISQLEAEGSLSSIRLPRTIQDAMFACGQLGQRYLWVDRLCILQDDENSKHGQIAHMDRIFGTAVFTIIALTGSDSQSGLVGVSKLRHIRFKTLEWPGFNLIEDPPQLKELVAESTWNKRGWTFQEDLCSRNNLYFTDYGVYHSRRLPDGRSWKTISECNVPERDLSTSLLFLNKLIEEYTTRIFAFPDDILRACTGALNRVAGDNHYFGAFFDEIVEGIHWQPLDWAHKRRTSLTEIFPSWSWSSAHGPIEFQPFTAFVSLWARPAYPEPGKHEALQWLSHNHAVIGLRYLTVDTGIVGAAEFPFSPEGEGERKDDFLSPSSLSVFGEHDRKRAHEKPGRILSFTQVATFSIRNLPYQFSDGRRTFSIRSVQNECVGGICLTAQSSEDVKGDNGVLREEPFEFLALTLVLFTDVKDIILGSGRDNHPSLLAAEIDEAKLDWKIRSVEKSLNVMLIVRDEASGVARRLGIGQVFEEEWLQARPDLKTVVLE